MNEYIELKKYYKNLPEDKPEKIIFEILCKLQATLKANKGNEIFLSEADFQFCFAQELDKALKNKGIEQPKIILEYPYSFKQTCKKGRAFIDLYFKFNSVNYFIEFKYKLTSILDTNNKDIFLKRYNHFFTIKSQGASNNGRYLIYQDIERMEKLNWNMLIQTLKLVNLMLFLLLMILNTGESIKKNLAKVTIILSRIK